MNTVYIDIYFLINFTVDLLALHLATVFSKVYTKNLRLLAGAFLSALYGCITLFISRNVVTMLAASIVVLVLISYVLISGISVLRRLKLIVAFLLFMTIIGGGVYFVFNWLGTYFPEYMSTAVQDRKLLILSVVILLAIAVIRLLFVLFFHANSEKFVHLIIEFNDRSLECDALVDSGNLLKDPTDLTPVMLIKADAARKLFPCGIPTIDSCDLGSTIDRYLRLIPINKAGMRSIALGVRPERVLVLRNNKYIETKLTFIIDDEKGRFGGCEALVPVSALENL